MKKKKYLEHQTLGRWFICPMDPATEREFILDWRISTYFTPLFVLAKSGELVYANSYNIWLVWVLCCFLEVGMAWIDP